MKVCACVCICVSLLTGCKTEVSLNAERIYRTIGTLYCKKYAGLKDIVHRTYSVSFVCRDNAVLKIGI